MKIGFDISQTGSNKAGCGFYADNLIRALAKVDQHNQYLLYPTFGDYYWDSHFPKVVKINQANFELGLRHYTLQQAKNFWHHFNENHEHHLGPVDVIHANNFFCPPKLKNTKLVFTLYDLSFLSHPEYSTEQNRAACFKGVLNASLNADHIVAISQYSHDHFLKTFPYFPAEKMSICYPASRFHQQSDIPNPSAKLKSLAEGKFWLNVGTIEPRKNQLGLLKAYAQLKAENIEHMPLVFAGGKGWLMENFEQEIQELDLQNDVIVLGYVNEDELQWLYKNCYSLIYPSFFEGFGMPVLEAMSLGAAVITSHSSSLPEIVGQAGILIDPANAAELASAMLQVAQNKNLHAELKTKALLQAQQFSWEKSAKKLINVYQKTVETT